MRHTTLLAFLAVALIHSRGEDAKYYSEPTPDYNQTYERKQQQNDSGSPKHSQGRDFYFDEYEGDGSDYKSHVYGEDSDYYVFRNANARKTARVGSGGASRKISGELDEVSTLNLENRRGTRESHHVVRLRLEDTGTILVDLGPTTLSNLDLEPGDRVEIQGRNGRINEKTVFFATQLKVNGQTFRIPRGESSRAVEFRGEVEGYEPLWIKDQWGDGHRVLKLTNTGGETRFIDLPADVSWRDLDIRLGCDVELRGTTRSIGNHQVVAANSVRVDGEEKIRW